MRGRPGITAGIASVVGLMAWLAVPTPVPAMAGSGALGVAPANVVAGTTGVTLTFTYAANTAFAGVVSLDVPAGFNPPQTAAAQGAGYIGVTSGSCARRSVSASNQSVQLSLRCSPGGTASVSYLVGSVPSTPGAYAFTAAADPVGSNAGGWLASPVVDVTAPSSVSAHASPTAAVSGVTVETIDAAVVNGVAGAVPTGSVTFTLYGDEACTVPVLGPVAVALSPATSSSALATLYDAWTPAAPGAYEWVASYGGDPDYSPSASACSSADQAVDVAAPDVSAGLSVQASPVTGSSGVTVSFGDSATVGGLDGLPPTGTVSFALYSDGQCTKAVPEVDATVVLGAISSGSSAASYIVTWTPPAAGTYSWGVAYSGDADYPAASVCGGPGNTITVG